MQAHSLFKTQDWRHLLSQCTNLATSCDDLDILSVVGLEVLLHQLTSQYNYYAIEWHQIICDLPLKPSKLTAESNLFISKHLHRESNDQQYAQCCFHLHLRQRHNRLSVPFPSSLGFYSHHWCRVLIFSPQFKINQWSWGWLVGY